MEESSDKRSILGNGEENFRCSQCHGTFQKPLLASDSSNGLVRIYYACPRCLSTFDNVKEFEGSEKNIGGLTAAEKNEEVHRDIAESGCKHFLGYLRKHPKDSAFPDECLVCEKMIECLSG